MHFTTRARLWVRFPQIAEKARLHFLGKSDIILSREVERTGQARMETVKTGFFLLAWDLRKKQKDGQGSIASAVFFVLMRPCNC